MPSKEEALRTSTEAAQKAAGLLGGTFEQGKGFTPGTVSAPGSSAGTTPVSGSDNSAFIEEVQNRLLSQADVVSSLDTELESRFSKAIGGVETAQEKSAQRITSQFDREITFQEGEGQAQIDTALEGRRGFGTQMVALRRLVETTDKSLKDLEQRKQELILQGESDAASQIATLQVQALQFRQQASQNAFSNLLGVGQFAQQQQQLSLAQKQFGLQERQFDLSTSQFALQKSNAAFERMAQLREIGALTSLPSEQLQQLELDAGLPEGTAAAIANAPRQKEIRAVGDTLIAIDPVTLESTVLYNGASSGASMVDLGGGSTVSFITSSVINGMQSLDKLTPTQQGEVISEMEKVGFSSDSPPDWFRDRAETSARQSLAPEGLNKVWNDYRSSIVLGPKFLTGDFIRTVVPEQTVKDAGQDPGTYYTNQEAAVQQWRNAGFSDKQIAEIMDFGI